MRTFLTAATMVSLLIVKTGQAETYHNEEHHFSLNLGEQWKPMPPDVLRGLALAEKKTNPTTSIQVIAGFHRIDSAPLECPYVVVFANPGLSARILSFEGFEKSIRNGLGNVSSQLNGAAKLMISDITAGQLIFERERHRAIARMKTKLGLFGSVDTLLHFYPGLNAGIQISGYFTDKDSEKYLPVLNEIADSFQFDKGHEFGQGLGFWSREWDNKTRTFMGTLIIGGVCGIVAPFAIRLHQRRSRKPNPA